MKDVVGSRNTVNGKLLSSSHYGFFGMLLKLKVEINSRIVTPFSGPKTVTASGCSWWNSAVEKRGLKCCNL
jgi:hypothetical protein